MHHVSWSIRAIEKILPAILFVTSCQLTAVAADTTNWVVFNDHARAAVIANVSGYTITTGAGAGGPLTNFLDGELITPSQVGVDIMPCCGTISGTTGSSDAPRAGTPADLIFGGKMDWAASAIYFAPLASVNANVTFTFTNLDAGKRYVFRGAAVRGNNYATRWTLATITGVANAVPAHILGTGSPASPGIVTNGWAPYGNNLVAGRQAGWNSGENRCGDVIGWDDIVPSGSSFSVICSNFYVTSTTVPTVGGGETTLDNYCYAFSAIMLAEVGEPGPVGITAQPPDAISVEEYSPLNISITVTGSFPRFQWYSGDLGSGTPIPGATAATYSVPQVRLSDAGNYYVVVTNELNSVTSTVAQVTVFVDPIVITQQPAPTTTVVVLRSFTLSAEATGTNPQFQWYRKDGDLLTALTDQTNTTYTVASAALSDDGEYVVVVTNSLYSETSSVARVIVSEDTINPTVVRVFPGATFDQVTVEFSERMDLVSAEDDFNYALSSGFVQSITLTNDARAVVIQTTPQTPDTLYTITVSVFDSITDLSGNALAETNLDYRSWVTNQAGGMVLETFSGIGTVFVTNLTNDPNFPDRPSATYGVGAFNPTNAFTVADSDASRENYGGRVRGWFFPPYSGLWRFFVSADDGAELYFNPAGADVAGKVLVAYVPGDDCCDPYQAPGNVRTSEPFDLIGGQGYYIEGLYKEAGGGDYLVVAARLASDPGIPNNATDWIMSEIGYPGIPPGYAGTVTIDTQPVSLSVEDPNPASFSIAVSSSTGAGIVYQWQRSDGLGGFTNVPGANAKSYSLPATTVAGDNGAQFRCVASAADVQMISDAVTLTVTPDMTGPALVLAVPDLTLTNITVRFSEEVAADGAGIAGNYTICQAFNAANCINVLSATVTNGGTQVLLTTEAPVSGTVYQLTVINVTDVAGNPLQAPNDVVVGVVAMFQEGDANGYTGTQDTLIEADSPAANHGADESVVVDDAGPLAHGLLRFDNIFGSAPGIPLGSTIESATLTLTTFDPGGLVNFYRMLAPWDEATATWTSMGAGIQLDDVEASSTVEDSIDSDTGFSTLDVTASLQAWADGADNYGWAMIHQGSGSDGGWDWRSSEYAAAPAERPMLTVIYTPSAATNSVMIVTQPAPSTILDEGDTLSLSVTVSGTEPQFQWFKDDVAIPGANSSTLTIPGTDETDSGTYHVVATNFLPSMVQSDDAVVTVNPDTNGPVLLSALGTSATTIILDFDQAVEGTSVSNLANYVVAPVFGGSALTIDSAELAANGTMVTLTTSARTDWIYYQLSVQNLTDTAFRLNPLVPNPTVLMLPYEVPVMAATSSWKFNDLGTDLGTEWIATGYDDQSWPETNALLWVQRFNAAINQADADVTIGGQMTWTNAILATDGNPSTNITYYFRGSFTMPAVPPGMQTWDLRLRGVIDDGIVVYLNGQEARRVRIADGPVTWSTFATGNGSNYRYDGTTYALPTTNVNFDAANQIAVELHQVNLTSSDAGFAVELYVDVPALVVEVIVESSGGAVTLSWLPVPGYRLYAADNVEGPYLPVLDGGNPVAPPYAVPAPLAAKKFYQLINP